jgi:hypothetical protein
MSYECAHLPRWFKFKLPIRLHFDATLEILNYVCLSEIRCPGAYDFVYPLCNILPAAVVGVLSMLAWRNELLHSSAFICRVSSNER